MKKILTLFVITFLVLAAQAQKKAKVTKVPSYNCAYLPRVSPDKLPFTFPFNEAAVIKLVSFDKPLTEEDRNKGGYIWGKSIIRRDPFAIAPGSGFDRKEIDTTTWKEQYVLPNEAYTKLGNILFNYRYKKAPAESNEGNCYIPHNAVLFYNSRNELFAVIEICFGCNRIETFPKKLEAGDMCTDRLSMLKDFFIQNHIQYGTLINPFR